MSDGLTARDRHALQGAKARLATRGKLPWTSSKTAWIGENVWITPRAKRVIENALEDIPALINIINHLTKAHERLTENFTVTFTGTAQLAEGSTQNAEQGQAADQG